MLPRDLSILVPGLPALIALAVGLAVTAWARGKGRAAWLRPGLALAALLGLAALVPPARLAGVALSPPVAPAMLILPAALVLAVEALRRWRAGRNDRLLSVLAALLVGWWLARTAAGPAEFWRVAILAAALTGAVAALLRQQPGRGLALALALCGGLAVAGAPPPWLAAAALLAAASAAPFALGVNVTVPSALTAATLAGADLARGRLARFHFDAADLTCLLALAAPLLAGLLERRVGKRWAPPLAAAAAVAVTWGLRRALRV